MPTGIGERDMFDDDENEDMFTDDENESGNSEQDTKLQKLIAEAEKAIADSLATENPNSGIYKGLQRHLNKRDQKIAQLEAYIAQLETGSKGDSKEVEFLKTIIPQMLDPKDREVFNREREQFFEKSKNTDLESMVQTLLNQQRGAQYVQQNSGEEDPRLVEYRRQATQELNSLAEVMGIDPKDNRLDFGNEADPLATRISKLRESASKIKKDDENISSVRRKKRVDTNVRDDNGSGKKTVLSGRPLIQRGLAQAIARMNE